jgi:hypothetical protein
VNGGGGGGEGGGRDGGGGTGGMGSKDPTLDVDADGREAGGIPLRCRMFHSISPIHAT